MDKIKIQSLLCQVQSGTISIDDAVNKLRVLPFEDLQGFARIDNHRSIRQGIPEVVFCQGKNPDQIYQIMMIDTLLGILDIYQM